MSNVWSEVQRARAAAHAKHGQNSIEALKGTDSRWLAVLTEEVGEVAHEQTYDATGDLRAELMDVLSVASAWVDALDRGAPRHTVSSSNDAVADLVEALRLTVEYVGLEVLPPLAGWSWFDALQRHAPEVAEHFEAQRVRQDMP